MKAESSSSAGSRAGDVGDTSPPLAWILDKEATGLDEWLSAHPANRLGVPAAFNNGKPAAPIWVLAVGLVNKIAELADDVTIAQDDTYSKAHQLMQTAAAEVDRIQQNDEIPIRSTGKMNMHKSKKQCRTEVQDTFHEQAMLMATDHPLWDQGRWTMLVKPSEIDRTFALLAKSLAAGHLQQQGNIVALRARMLPLGESTHDMSSNSPKRKKNYVTSSRRSPPSARHASDQPLGIDIFFRKAWSSTEARNVLQAVAEASGRMASNCKASLYARLGINSNHALGVHASLYNSKTLANPADSKTWILKYHHSAGGAAHASVGLESQSSQEIAEPSSKAATSSLSTTMPAPAQADAKEAGVKRELEVNLGDGAEAEAGEPVSKKARNGEAFEGQEATAEEKPAHNSGSSSLGELETQETQDEPMLPLRPNPQPQPGKFMNQTALEPVSEEKAADKLDVLVDVEDESQTQIEQVPSKEQISPVSNSPVVEASTVKKEVAAAAVVKDVIMEPSAASAEVVPDDAEPKPTVTSDTLTVGSEVPKQPESSEQGSKKEVAAIEDDEVAQPLPPAITNEDIKPTKDEDVEMAAAVRTTENASSTDEPKQTTAQKVGVLEDTTLGDPVSAENSSTAAQKVDSGEEAANDSTDDADGEPDESPFSRDEAAQVSDSKPALKIEDVLRDTSFGYTISEAFEREVTTYTTLRRPEEFRPPEDEDAKMVAALQSGEADPSTSSTSAVVKEGDVKEPAEAESEEAKEPAKSAVPEQEERAGERTKPEEGSQASKTQTEEDKSTTADPANGSASAVTSAPEAVEMKTDGGDQAEPSAGKPSEESHKDHAKTETEPLKTAAEEASQDIAAHISEGVANIVEAALTISSSTSKPAADSSSHTKPDSKALELPRPSQKDSHEVSNAETAAADKPESQQSAPEMSIDDLIVEGATASPTDDSTQPTQPVAGDGASK